MTAYYNEIEPYAAEWLRNLIAEGLIAPGDVDERSIEEVAPDEIEGYTQCHFFAGIGGWGHALRLAGWPDERPVWTGSVPCQPLSSAGQRRGHADRRHLWPAFFRLIAERRPATVFGEQVASKLGREWLAGVRADLEHVGYACGAADLPAACVGAPHIRQRLWWVAERLADAGRSSVQRGLRPGEAPGARQRQRSGSDARSGSTDGGLDHTAEPRCPGPLQPGTVAASRDEARMPESERRSRTRGMGDPSRGGRLEECADSGRGDEGSETEGSPQRPGHDGSDGGLGDADDGRLEGPRISRGGQPGAAWAGEYIPCGDGKARRVESGTFPLAHGVPNRVGRLRAYGNAIVPQLAAAFIGAYRDVMAVT